MSSLDFLALLRTKLEEYAALLAAATPADLVTRVPSCGDWTLYDLTDHLGRGGIWVAAAVEERHGEAGRDEGLAPRDPAALYIWFTGTTESMLDALSADPDAEAWTFTDQLPKTVGFWRRRRAQETLIHLWDAQNALGKPEPLGEAEACDGIDEVFDFFARRMIIRGLAAEPERALRLTATDAGRSWTHGPGEPVAELSGTASDLLLLLWQRLDAAAPGLAWTGDRETGERLLAGPLTP